MDNFHRHIVSSLAVTATHASAILTVKRYKRADRMAARIVADIILKEKTTQWVSFADEQVETMKDFSMPQMFLSENRNYSTTV